MGTGGGLLAFEAFEYGLQARDGGVDTRGRGFRALGRALGARCGSLGSLARLVGSDRQGAARQNESERQDPEMVAVASLHGSRTLGGRFPAVNRRVQRGDDSGSVRDYTRCP